MCEERCVPHISHRDIHKQTHLGLKGQRLHLAAAELLHNSHTARARGQVEGCLALAINLIHTLCCLRRNFVLHSCEPKAWDISRATQRRVHVRPGHAWMRCTSPCAMMQGLRAALSTSSERACQSRAEKQQVSVRAMLAYLSGQQ